MTDGVLAGVGNCGDGILTSHPDVFALQSAAFDYAPAQGLHLIFISVNTRCKLDQLISY